MRLTAPQIPTMGSTEDQITTQTKFPRSLTSADSVSRIMRITRHIGRVYFREADNSNNTDKANTVIRVSGRSSGDWKVDTLTIQLSERNQSRHISAVSKSAGATAEVRASEVRGRTMKASGPLTKQTIKRSSTVLIDPDMIRLFIGFMQWPACPECQYFRIGRLTCQFVPVEYRYKDTYH